MHPRPPLTLITYAFFLLSLGACGKISNRFDPTILDCGADASTTLRGADNILKILAPNGARLSKDDARNLSAAIIDNGGESRVSTSDRGCVGIFGGGGSKDLRVGISAKSWGQLIALNSLQGRGSSVDAPLKAIAPIPAASLACPSSRLLAVNRAEALTQALKFEGESLPPFTASLMLSASENQFALATKAYRSSLLLADTSPLPPDGMYEASIKVIDVFGKEWEAPLGCAVRIDTERPEVKMLGTITGSAPDSVKNVPIGQALEIAHSDSDLMACTARLPDISVDTASPTLCTTRPECTDNPELFKKVSDLVLNEPGISLVRYFGRDAATNESSVVECFIAAVDAKNPQLAVKWTSQSHETPFQIASFWKNSFALAVDVSDDGTSRDLMLSSLECRVDFSGSDTYKSGGEIVRCDNGPCAGLNLNSWTRCSTTPAFSFLDNVKPPIDTALTFHVRAKDAAGRTSEDSVSVWINRSQVAPWTLFDAKLNAKFHWNSVKAMMLDHAGRMWVGGSFGVGRFSSPPTKANQISELFTWYRWADFNFPHYDINSMFEDSNHKVWFGTPSGLWCYTESAATTPVETFGPCTSYDATAIQNVVTITEDTLKRVWVGSEQGLFRNDGNHWTRFSADNRLLPVSEITDIAADEDGGIFVSSRLSGLVHISKNDEIKLFGPSDGIPDRRLGAMVFDSKRQVLWVAQTAAERANLFQLNLRSKQWTVYEAKQSNVRGRINDLGVDANGDLWLATDNGVIAFDGLAWRHYRVHQGERDVVYKVLPVTPTAERPTPLWVGTDEAGFGSLINGSAWAVFPHPSGGLTNAAAIDSKGRMWLGSVAGQLRALAPHGWLNFDTALQAGTPGGVTALAGSQGTDRVFVGTDQGDTLGVVDALSVWQHWPLRSSDGRICTNVRSLFTEADKSVWVGCANGLMHLDENGHHLRLPEALLTGTNGRWVQAMFRDFQGALWIGMRNGFARFDGANFTSGDNVDVRTFIEDKTHQTILIGHSAGLYAANSVTARKQPESPFSSTEETPVNGLARSNGAIWILYGNDIKRYDEARGTWLPELLGYLNPNFAISNGILNILTDSKERIWLSLPLGVARAMTHEGTQ